MSAALRLAAAALVALTVLAPAPARPDGLTISAEPSANAARTDTQGEGLPGTRRDSLTLEQRYRLQFQRELFPLLRLGGNASYEQRNTVQHDDPIERGESRLGTMGLRLDLGAGVWSGGAAFDLRGEESSAKTGQAPRLESPRRYVQVLTAFGAWRPADLPSVDLRHTRTRTWDDAGDGVDQGTRITTLQSSYSPAQSVDLRYRGSYVVTGNEATGVDDHALAHALRVAWSESFLDRRGSVFASVDAGQSRRWTEATRAGGTRETQQTLAAGLSAVERFPTLPDRVTLETNAALADGNTAAGAGIDLGYGRSDAGDTDLRDLGARFLDAVTPVNQLRVWLDQRLTAPVAGALTFEAYRSDDNVTWTPVALAGAPSFSTLENRFEIPIVRTAARYLKLVVRPLASGVTTDRTFQQLLVTELQAFLVETLTTAREVDLAHRVSGSVTGRLVLQRSWNVTWDSFLDAGRSSNRDFTQWILSNGLSFTRRVAQPLVLSGRAERSDADAGDGLETGYRANVASSYEPLPALGATLSVGVSRNERQGAVQDQASSQVGLRADLYQGVSVSTQGDFSLGRSSGGVRTRRVAATGNAAITPHRTLTFAGSFTYSDSRTERPATAELSDKAARVDGSVSWTPVPSVGVSGSIGREMFRRSGTIASLGVNASPFRDGALQLSFSYAESLDTTIDSRTRAWGPSLRWRMMRRGYLDLAYTDTHTSSAASTTDAQVLFAKLLLSMG